MFRFMYTCVTYSSRALLEYNYDIASHVHDGCVNDSNLNGNYALSESRSDWGILNKQEFMILKCAFSYIQKPVAKQNS